MAEPDRRREVQDAPAAARSPRPDVAARGGVDPAVDEVGDGEVDGDGIANEGEVAGALEHDELAAHELGERSALVDVLAHVAVAMYDERRDADVATLFLERRAIG